MLHKMVFPGKYIQGAGAAGELPVLVKLFGSRGLILASPTVHTRVLPESGIDLEVNGLLVEPFSGECCEKELSRVAAVIRDNNVDVLVGMGGGKTIDTVKIAAPMESGSATRLDPNRARQQPLAGFARLVHVLRDLRGVA